MRTIHTVGNFTDLQQYLREFRSWNEDEYAYDFTGAISLFLSLLDNIEEFALEVELEDIGFCLTDRQRLFLANLSAMANRITDEMIE
jgi:hypothetical protein